MGRGHRSIGVLLVVIIAGCSGMSAGVDGPAMTVTPAAVPSDEPTATPDVQNQIGIDEESFVDPDAMIAAHRSVLRDASYTVFATQTIRFPVSNRSGQWNLSYRRTTDGSFTIVTERNGSVFGTDRPIWIGFWSDGDVVVEAYLSNGTATANVIRDAHGNPVSPGAVMPVDSRFGAELHTVFTSLSVQSVDRLPGGDYPYTRVRVEAVGPIGEDVVGSLEVATSVRNLSAVLVFDERGFVHRYELRYTGRFGTAPVTVSRTVRYAAIGETIVEQPDWVEPALNGTGYASSSESNGSS